MTKQAVIGCVSMTHLGLLHSTAFAEKGFQLVCFDESPALINSLQKGNLPVSEPKLDDLVKKNQARLTFTHDREQLRGCDLIFIACDVPTDNKGNSDLTIIYRLVELVKPVLANHASLVLLSQVPPGFTRKIDLPKERLFYQVETLIFGRAVERALYPERYIVGVNDPQKDLPATYADLLESFNCPILKMRYESAELAKISINLFLVASVTTTNTLAEICEAIGADWNEIAPALRLDKRIGQYAYLSPGLGIAGGNLERDLNTIIKLGERHHTNTDTVSAWIKNSEHRREWVLHCLQEQVFAKIENPVICVLGLAYKPNTHSIKNSPSIALLNRLCDCKVTIHDPEVEIEHPGLKASVDEAILGAEVLIIMTPWPEYKQLLPAALKKAKNQLKIMIDPYGLFVDNSCQENFRYYSLGKRYNKEDTCSHI